MDINSSNRGKKSSELNFNAPGRFFKLIFLLIQQFWSFTQWFSFFIVDFGCQVKIKRNSEIKLKKKYWTEKWQQIFYVMEFYKKDETVMLNFFSARSMNSHRAVGLVRRWQSCTNWVKQTYVYLVNKLF